MSRFPKLTVGLIVMSALACDQDHFQSISGPDGPSLASGGIPGGGFPRERAQGHVKVTQSNVNDRSTFLALRDGQGQPRGAFEWVSERPDGTIVSGSGKIVCLTVFGNVAHVAGIFEEEDAYWITPPNNYAIWSVQDNGKGKDAPPDVASGLLVGATEAQVEIHCQTGSFLATVPNQGGDIVVEDDDPAVTSDKN
jgi:hypothetical protein